MNPKRSFVRFVSENRLLMPLLIALTAVGITVSAIVYEQSFFRILPLYISLFVMAFQSRGLRIAPLLGSLNSLLYAVIFFHYSLYASMLNSALVAFPFQLIAFFRWTKRKDGATTHFRVMGWRARLLFVATLAVLYVPYLFLNRALGTQYLFLDTAASLFSLSATFLMMMAFWEYTLVASTSFFTQTTMYILMLTTLPEQLPYAIYMSYATLCNLRGAVNVRLIFNRQSAIQEHT